MRRSASGVSACGFSRPCASGLPSSRGIDLFEREDREQGDDVGERFVEGGLIREPGFGETRPEAVQHGVGRFVRDHVVGEAGLHLGAAV